MGLWDDVWKGGFDSANITKMDLQEFKLSLSSVPKGMSDHELLGYLKRKRVLFYEAAIKGVIEQNEKIIEQNEEILKLLKKEKID